MEPVQVTPGPHWPLVEIIVPLEGGAEVVVEEVVDEIGLVEEDEVDDVCRLVRKRKKVT